MRINVLRSIKKVFLLGLLGCVLTTSTRAEEVIKFAIIPLEDKAIMLKKFTPLANYLTKKLGKKVKLVVPKDYEATMIGIGEEKFQIAYLTPTTFPKAFMLNPGAGIKPLVKFAKHGAATYKSCIILPKNSKIKSVKELKGKSFAFGSPDSTSSHLMPRSLLAKEGITIDDIKKQYLGSHSKVAKAIAAGKFAAGGVKESVADKYAKEGKIRILIKSNPIPEFPICANDTLSEKMTNKLYNALMELNKPTPEHTKVLKSISKKFTGVVKAEIKDYDVIVKMILKIFGDDFYDEDFGKNK